MRRLDRRVHLALAVGLLASVAACKGPSTPEGGPIGPPSRKLVDAAGGSVTSADGVLTVTIPPGALSTPTDIVIQAITNGAPQGQGNAYRVGPPSQLFASPVTFLFRNTTAQPTASLWLSFQLNQSLWLRAGAVAIDGTANTLTTSVNDFGWTDWSIVATGNAAVHKRELEQFLAEAFG